MIPLLKIKKSAQQIAEAISASLNISVEITDNNLQCIAGTGEFINFIGTKLNGYIHSRVLNSGKTYVIENPGYHEFCKPCSRLQSCYATSEICVPIICSKNIVGVLGLVSLNSEQKARLLSASDSHVNFLKKMSELLSAKLNELELMERQAFLNNQLSTVISFIDQGIIATDEYGIITHINNYAEGFLGSSITGKRLTSVLTNEAINNIFITNTYFKNEQLDLKNGSQTAKVIGNAHPVLTNSKKTGVVLTFRSIADAVKISFKANNLLMYKFEDIIGTSREISEMKERALRISSSDSTVLIQGESGTGKEIVARAIHSNSSRAREHFITINCGAIPEALLESELFGYEDGAFTGAKKGGKLGKFELANGGTIFLDEIGDMPLHLQVKLLRVLQEKVIERIGGALSLPIDVRVIAATNRNLEEMAKENQFRWDLYYRLNVIPIYIPPLRERKEDILILAKHFLDLYDLKIKKKVKALSKESEQLLLNYSWPGNIRELANAIEYGVNMENSPILESHNLPPKLKQQAFTLPFGGNFTNGMQSMEYELICNALSKYGDTTEGKKKVAAYLGISLATLYRKLKIYNIG